MQKVFLNHNATVELAAPASTNSSVIAENTLPGQEENGGRPKVIVPDIEEELRFLIVDPIANSSTSAVNEKKQQPQLVVKMPEKKPITLPASVNNGFMASYIKFLQGERDTSPPPVNKTRYSRIAKLNKSPAESAKMSEIRRRTKKLPLVLEPNPVSNPRNLPNPKTNVYGSSVNSSNNENNLSLGKNDHLSVLKSRGPLSAVVKDSKVAKDSVGNNELGKDTVKKNSSEKNIGSDYFDSAEKIQLLSNKAKQENHANKPDDRDARKKEMGKRSSAKEYEIQNDEPDNIVPRRETSTRKAKERSSIRKFIEEEYDDPDEFNSINSDSDPAWSPAAVKEDSDDDFDNRRKTRNRAQRGSAQKGRKRARRSVTESSSEEDLEKSAKQRKCVARTKVTPPKASSQPNNKSTNDANTEASIISGETKEASQVVGFPFSVGEFVVVKSELSEEYPAIWRVDGKTLLQKYEPFEQNGETIYRNIPTYSGWTTQNKNSFQVVPVRIRLQGRSETIVELLRSEMKMTEEEKSEMAVEEIEEVANPTLCAEPNITSEAVDKIMEESLQYKDNFDVYVQTLISQALDANFLAEIIQENDEYFLLSVKAIDEVTDARGKRLMELAGWQDCMVERSVATWPCYNVLQGISKEDMASKTCAACKKQNIFNRVIVYGQPYNSANLEGCAPDPEITGHKDFLLCRKCVSVVSLYNKIAHQKYLMFIECAKRVQEKRTTDPSKDTTVILNELLDDETWLGYLFRNVRLTWGQVERLQKDDDKFEFVNSNYAADSDSTLNSSTAAN